MKIIYRDHAVTRMSERNISTADVALILANPDGKIRQSADKWIYFKSIPKRLDNAVAVVTVVLTPSQFEVITVMIHFALR